jgi:cytochrome c
MTHSFGLPGLALFIVTIAAVRLPTPTVESKAELPLPGNAANGERLFNRRCSGCHSLVEHRTGPRLGDVYGRRVGAAVGYRYSESVSAQQFVWADSTLDLWLAGPRDFIRGAAMPVRIGKANERADIIAYLRTVTLSTDPARGEISPIRERQR